MKNILLVTYQSFIINVFLLIRLKDFGENLMNIPEELLNDSSTEEECSVGTNDSISHHLWNQ